MSKPSFFVFALLLSSFLVHSQAYQGKIDYNKKKQEAVIMDFSYPQEAVKNAIVQRIEGMGNEAKQEKGLFNRDKGFIVFKNAVVKEISLQNLDYIFKIERKSRKESDESTVYLIVARDDENILTSDAASLSKARSFLNELKPHVESSHLEIQIKDQEQIVTKAEKKFKDLQDDQKSMEKKIKDLEDDLQKNAKNQEDQQKLIENQRQALEALKGKRK